MSCANGSENNKRGISTLRTLRLSVFLCVNFILAAYLTQRTQRAAEFAEKTFKLRYYRQRSHLSQLASDWSTIIFSNHHARRAGTTTTWSIRP